MACSRQIPPDTCQAAIPAKGNAGDSDNFDPELWDNCTKFANQYFNETRDVCF
jgi:hypothetical protein